jgi:HlyD family secretion protein
MNIENRIPDKSEIETTLGIDGSSRRRSLFRRAVWVLTAFAVLAGLSGWYLYQADTATRLSYTTQPATIRDLEISVSATGTTEPTQIVDISSELSGVVRNVMVDYNDTVQKGDVLAELDVERRVAQRNRAQAAVNATEARVKEAQATATERTLALQRLERLGEKGFTPEQDLETARAASARAMAALISAQSDVEVAKADLLLQQTDVDKSYIRSPIDGVVLKRAVEPGQTVASSFQAPVLLTIAGDLKAMRLEADIDEADIGSVAEGQTATFTVDAYPGKEFEAVVTEIYFAPETVEGVVTYKAILTVDNSELLLRPGMTATARIITQDIKQALTIPNAALRYAPPKEKPADTRNLISRIFPRMPRMSSATENLPMSGERTVYVLRNGIQEPVNVRVGASDGSYSHVESGNLAADDQLIVDATQVQD